MVVVSVMLMSVGTCSMVLSPCVALVCHKLLSPDEFCLLPVCAGSELALKADSIQLQMVCCSLTGTGFPNISEHQESTLVCRLPRKVRVLGQW